MVYHFTLFYPKNLEPLPVNDVLRKLLIPRKWRHYLRIEQNITINGKYRYFNQEISPGDKIDITLDQAKSSPAKLGLYSGSPTIGVPRDAKCTRI